MISTPLDQRVRDALARVIDPEIRRPITELDMIGAVRIDGDRATVDLKLTIVGCPAADTIERDVREAALSTGIGAVDVRVSVMSREERAALTEKLRGGRPKTLQFGPDSLTRIYAVTSGKGGVGKSTLTANLGVALAARGLRVGIVDADVFGFSIPGLLGVAGAKPTQVDEMILPPVAHGVKVISIGMFVDGNTAVSWRGPMLHRTLQQFLTDVFFGDLDVLLLDLPPGTGDIAISLGQLLPQAEVLVVTTPQAAAAEVAERSGLVARQTGQTVIGVVENMAGLPQPDGTVLRLFGEGGGADAAARLSTPEQPVPLLASVPLSLALREGGDAGLPVVLGHPDDPAAVAITALAAALATRSRGLAGRKLGLSVARE
jgi:ATP-binding protein involved in chromosome partitioning